METVAAAARTQVYRPRHPERAVLYRALAHHFERLFRAEVPRMLLGKEVIEAVGRDLLS